MSRKNLYAVLGGTLLFFGGVSGAAEHAGQTGHFAAPSRVTYLGKAIAAFRESPRDRIENIAAHISLLERSRCHAAVEGMTVACLQEEVRKSCLMSNVSFRARCPLISDILVVNKVNEKQFVSREERLAMMKRSSAPSFGRAYARLLRRKHALLASEFLLLSTEQCPDADNACLAREMNHYCLKHADSKNLAWQACVGAIVGFIGSAGEGRDRL